MDRARFYESGSVSAQDLAAATTQWFQSRYYETYTFSDGQGRVVVQARKASVTRSIFGLSLALTVVFTPQQEGRILVELGGAEWGDKLVSGLLGLAFIFPLAVTAAVGVWQQGDLYEQVYVQIANYIASRIGHPPVVTPAAPAMPGYGGYVPYGYAPYTPPQYYQPYSAYAPRPQQSQRLSWFDSSSIEPVFNTTYMRLATWQAAMADGVIKPDEVETQAALVAQLQRQAEEALNTDQKIRLAEILAAMAALDKEHASAA